MESQHHDDGDDVKCPWNMPIVYTFTAANADTNTIHFFLYKFWKLLALNTKQNIVYRTDPSDRTI